MTEKMEVEVIPSPTELAEATDEERMEGDPPGSEVRAKDEKERKKRHREAGHVKKQIPDEDDDPDLDSPSKRALQGGEAPLSANEIRSLLFGHVNEMKEAWRNFQGRIDQVELQQVQHGHEMQAVKMRTKILEQDSASHRQALDQTNRNMDELTEEVKNMKVQLENVSTNKGILPAAAPGPSTTSLRATTANDPWGDYLRGRAAASGSKDEGSGVTLAANAGKDRTGDGLSEEDKRTLVIGGWLRDTKKQVIEEEFAKAIDNEEVKKFLDTTTLAIYGPRRSVGMLKFEARPGESNAEMKERMWGVIKFFASLKLVLPSTAGTGAEPKVAISLAADTKDEKGGVKCLLNTAFTAYDCDWFPEIVNTFSCLVAGLISMSWQLQQDAASTPLRRRWNVNSEITKRPVSPQVSTLMIPCQTHLLHRPIALRDLAHVGMYLGRVENIAGAELHAGTWEDKNMTFWMWLRQMRIFFVYRKLLADLVVGMKWTPKSFTGSCIVMILSGGELEAISEFFGSLPGKWRQYPLICGVDSNEKVAWLLDEGEGAADLHVAEGSNNFNALLDAALKEGCQLVAPEAHQRDQPTHFPRDEERRGKQIDLVLVRQTCTTKLSIEPDRRHVIGSDHAFLHFEVLTASSRAAKWGGDSRARYMCKELYDETIVDEDDLIKLATECSKPRRSRAYQDSSEIKDAIQLAKQNNDKATWKAVHRMRRQARIDWQRSRLARILNGSWDEFRQLQSEKKKRRGWWGEMLVDRSASELTTAVCDHFEKKMVDPDRQNWDDELTEIIGSIVVEGEFQVFSLLDVRVELQAMRARSAVGPDGLGVDFLRHAASHETIGPQLCELINHIVSTLATPASWKKSFLALLAKTKQPQHPGDLRPIAVSSAFNKLVNRLVCTRAMPACRRGSPVSACGKGRQAADLIGAASRIRDVVREWRLPALLGKLDVAGLVENSDIFYINYIRMYWKVLIGEEDFKIAPIGESLKILGLSFSFAEKPSQQAQELLARTRAAAAAHKDILQAHGAWMKKMSILRSLVESQYAWTAGAVHWSSTDLAAANTMTGSRGIPALFVSAVFGSTTTVARDGVKRFSLYNTTSLDIGHEDVKFSKTERASPVSRCEHFCGGPLHGGDTSNPLALQLAFDMQVAADRFAWYPLVCLLSSRRGIKNLLLVPPLAMAVVAAWSMTPPPSLCLLHVLWTLLQPLPVLGGWDEDWGDFVADDNNQPAESWRENTWQPSSRPPTACPSSTLTPSSWPCPSSCSSSPPTHDANYMMYMANIWEEFEEAKQLPLPEPNMEPDDAACQWDEEVSCAEQLEEFHYDAPPRPSGWDAVHTADSTPADCEQNDGQAREAWLQALQDTNELVVAESLAHFHYILMFNHKLDGLDDVGDRELFLLLFAVVGQTTVDGENVVEAVTFYGESFQVWGESGSVQPDVNDAPPPALGLSESPQPAIDTDGAVADTESSHESSGDGVNHTVGFWRNGEWASAAPAEPDEEDDLGLWVQDNEAASYFVVLFQFMVVVEYELSVGGVPAGIIQRLEAFLQQLDDRQELYGTGEETAVSPVVTPPDAVGIWREVETEAGMEAHNDYNSDYFGDVDEFFYFFDLDTVYYPFFEYFVDFGNAHNDYITLYFGALDELLYFCDLIREYNPTLKFNTDFDEALFGYISFGPGSRLHWRSSARGLPRRRMLFLLMLVKQRPSPTKNFEFLTLVFCLSALTLPGFFLVKLLVVANIDLGRHHDLENVRYRRKEKLKVGKQARMLTSWDQWMPVCTCLLLRLLALWGDGVDDRGAYTCCHDY
ncbi:unnamed protein product [Symbiodinium sp. KB8]|nr:unnamed protein product [Symbiodinium sp. KB8]